MQRRGEHHGEGRYGSILVCGGGGGGGMSGGLWMYFVQYTQRRNMMHHNTSRSSKIGAEFQLLTACDMYL